MTQYFSMNFDHLKIFCDLVSTGSFSKAAKLNGLTQSAVSQQLKIVEKKLGAIAVDRSAKQFRLTEEGIKLHQFAIEEIQRYNQLKNEIAHMQKIITGTVNVSTIVSIGFHELPFYVKRFLRQYPHVNVHVEYRRATLVYQDILDEKADIGLVAFANCEHKDLASFPFREDELVVVCHPDHPLSRETEINPHDILKYKLIGFDFDIPTRKGTDEFFRKNFGIELKPILEFDNVEIIKRAVEIDSGIALVPVSTIEAELRQRSLVGIKLRDHRIIRPLSVICRKDRLQSPSIERFLDVLTGMKAAALVAAELKIAIAEAS
jgi:LysR family transcriptional regulator, transcriptional activator of the cysJI operon